MDYDAILGHTTLHRAAWRCDKQQVQTLIVAGEDVNARDKQGHTPLHRVAEPYPHAQVTDEQQVEVGRILLLAGAAVNATTHQSVTPLHQAALFGHGEMVRLLLEHGAAVNAVTDNGWTPLHSAVVSGHAGVAEVLLTHGADMHCSGADITGLIGPALDTSLREYTPLQMAVQALEWAQRPVEQGAAESDEMASAGIDLEQWRRQDVARLEATLAVLRLFGALP